MVDPTSPLLLLRRALATDMNANAIGVYKTTGSYLATERGIFTNGPTLPTTLDNCIVLTSLPSIPEDRANLIHRIQIFGRVDGNNIAAENLEQLIFARYDHSHGIPTGFNISWMSRFSTLQFEPDSSGRASFAATYYLRGRR